MDSIPEEKEPETALVPLLMVPELPQTKFHEGHLPFISQSQLTPREYERKLIAYGPKFDPSKPPDDDITVRCPNGNGSNIDFHISKSALARAPLFHKFFKSEHYVWGSEVRITFVVVPAAIFDIIQRYVEQGPEVFDITCLRLSVYRRYFHLARITTLVRLFIIAHNMGLWYLEDMTYEVLVDGNRFVTAPMLPLLAPIVFDARTHNDESLRKWFLAHVGHFYLALKDSEDWARCLPQCDDKLTEEWNKTVEVNTSILYEVENVSNDSVLEGRFKKMSNQDQDRAISAIAEKQAMSPTSPSFPVMSTKTPDTATSTAVSSQETLLNMLKPIAYKPPNGDNDWEDIGSPTATTASPVVYGPKPRSPTTPLPRTPTNTHASAVEKVSDENEPGPLTGKTLVDASGDELDGRRSSLTRNNAEEIAKARKMLGINEHIGPNTRPLMKASMDENDRAGTDTNSVEGMMSGREVAKEMRKPVVVKGSALKKKRSEVRASKRKTRILNMLH